MKKLIIAALLLHLGVVSALAADITGNYMSDHGMVTIRQAGQDYSVVVETATEDGNGSCFFEGAARLDGDVLTATASSDNQAVLILVLSGNKVVVEDRNNLSSPRHEFCGLNGLVALGGEFVKN